MVNHIPVLSNSTPEGRDLYSSYSLQLYLQRSYDRIRVDLGAERNDIAVLDPIILERVVESRLNSSRCGIFWAVRNFTLHICRPRFGNFTCFDDPRVYWKISRLYVRFHCS